MSYRTVISGLEYVRALEKVGFVVVRQRGRYISMVRDEPFAQVVIPNYASWIEAP